jgi:hypothetical protein
MTSIGPQEVLGAARAAAEALAPALTPDAVAGSRAEWAAALGELQRVADVVAAAQDAALVALVAIEEEYAEDGTVREVHRGRGHVALDAPGVVAGTLVLSSVQAERRVRSAVRLAGDGPTGTATATGLGGLHDAMAAGRLDGWRAQVVAEELELAPPEVAAGVVASLAPFFETDDGASLRRRCRRVVARVSPDLLRQRAVRARAESRLERWASEPGVDTWHGTFPSEEAARAWAAVDALAQRYVVQGVCPSIGRARAKALTDLVEGAATIETVVTVVVPHDASTVSPAGVPAPTPVDVAQGSQGAEGAGRADGPDPANDADAVDETHETDDIREIDVAGEVDRAGGTDEADKGDGTVDAARRSSGDDLVEVAGLRAGEPVLVPRRWLQDAIAATRREGPDSRGRRRVRAVASPSPVVPGDTVTGALIDPDGELTTDAYRPGARLAALVRARDGRCRFPGCHVAARFCDLDHVRPWPAGPTAVGNLICLCRRHHRVKQRPGWRVVLAPDGTATWTDPTGRVRTTLPVDTLGQVVLAAPADESDPPPTVSGRVTVPDGPYSPSESALEHRLAGRRTAPSCRVEVHRPDPERWRHSGLPHSVRPSQYRRRRSRPSDDRPPGAPPSGGARPEASPPDDPPPD